MRTLTVLANSTDDQDANALSGAPKRDFSLGNHGQSPVNLTNPHIVDIKGIEFHYPEEVVIEVVHNALTIQANITTPNAYILVDDQRYDLLQFHTHTPSEHRILDKHYDFELHFVHKNKETGIFVVVGILATLDQSLAISFLPGMKADIAALTKDLALAPFINILNAAPAEPNIKTDSLLGITSIRLHDLLPDDRRRFRYLGSFTTEPYTEIIDWNVIAQPVIISQQTIDAVTRFTGTNNTRDIQPTSGRPIVLERGPKS